MNLKLGSLFDGSGTAPLAASMCGIEPVWASEIEKYPIAVTTARFPNMKHLGDITKIDGAAVEPVDIICGGSPCQDLSVAGKQAGLYKGERSHLFFEMTRIIKQMREATNGKYPRYIIWENVPGAFSSNKGYDFLAVFKAFAEIADPEIYVPEPKQKAHGSGLAWQPAGFVAGDGWSIAWRTVDAQYWGVPQRRRRIYLVADFAGECADEILFERTSMPGDSESRRAAVTADPAAKCYVWDARGNGTGGVPTLTGNHENRATDYTALAIGNGQLHQISMAEQSNTLDCMHDKQAVLTNGKPPRKYIVRRLTPLECCRLQGFPDWYIYGCETFPVTGWWLENNDWMRVVNPHGAVEGSDSAMYRLRGNGMAFPNMLHVMRGIARMEERTNAEM